MRDTFKPDGLRQVINDIYQSNQRLIKGFKIADKSRHPSLKRMVLSNNLEKTIAHYSVGDSKEVVCSSLLKTIDAFEEGFKWKGFKYSYGGYDTMIWLVSLGVLCNIATEDFKRITAILQRDGANDTLLSTIITYKQPDWQVSNAPVIQQHPYAKATGIENAQDIKNYLNKVWYQGHSDAYWHGLHKNTRVNNYFGYWSWESAALAKIKNIDDSTLKTQKYYPYDAVHW